MRSEIPTDTPADVRSEQEHAEILRERLRVFVKTLDPALKDVRHALTLPQSDSQRRHLMRALFVLVDAACNVHGAFSQAVATAKRDLGADSEDGRGLRWDDHCGLSKRVRASLTDFAGMLNVEPPRFDARECGMAGDAKTIRDALIHPKKPEDFDVRRPEWARAEGWLGVVLQEVTRLRAHYGATYSQPGPAATPAQPPSR